MNSPKHRLLSWLTPALLAGAALVPGRQDREESAADESRPFHVQYLEIVTPDRDATCDLLTKLHGVEFGAPVAAFGDARTAPLQGGGTLGVRAPMHAAERTVVRPYLQVDDIEGAVRAAAEAGAEIAMSATETVDGAEFAIYFHGGIEHALWTD